MITPDTEEFGACVALACVATWWPDGAAARGDATVEVGVGILVVELPGVSDLSGFAFLIGRFVPGGQCA
jgi:hypothetical protein